jgi:hypothetical protein
MLIAFWAAASAQAVEFSVGVRESEESKNFCKSDLFLAS